MKKLCCVGLMIEIYVFCQWSYWLGWYGCWDGFGVIYVVRICGFVGGFLGFV